MNITGLITEYNPFHKGHLYHIEEARRLTGADYVIALMSGSYVQRGEPAVFDKYVRTRAALSCGADLVLEMPAPFSTASAREFASYGVSLFSSLGAVSSVVFGSESGDRNGFLKAADLLADETPAFRRILKEELKAGKTYPQARAAAALSLHPECAASLEELLRTPNNILGLEYVLAGRSLCSSLRFETVKRSGSGYHDTETAPSEDSFSSASAIRSLLQKSGSVSSLTGLIPDAAFQAFRSAVPVFPEDFSLLLNERILRGSFEGIQDLTPELAARLSNTEYRPQTLKEWTVCLKTRQFTYTRVSRALLHLLLGFQEEKLTEYKEAGYAPYARILGFRTESAPLLKELKKKSQIPLLTKVADAPKLLSPAGLSLLNDEIRASHLYETVRSKKGGDFQNEYRTGVVMVP